MIRHLLIFGILLAFVAGCQLQAEDAAEEKSQAVVTGNPPKTAAACEQQLLVLLANPVCRAAMQAQQAERHQQGMRDFERMTPPRPLSRLPRAQ